jgi:Mrp family chromosome partitioning ATPase/capsular polysaccharide biosynthesis protein
MTLQQDEGLSLHSYLRVLSRWKWLIIGATIVVGFLGAAYTYTRTPLYQAGAQLLYQQQINPTNNFNGIDTNQQQADIGSVPAVVASSQVGGAAARTLSAKDRAAGYSTSVGLQTDPNTSGYASVVTIAGVSQDPQVAADVANAYANAFVAWRQDNARASLTKEIAAVQSSLAGLSKTSASYQTLSSQLQNLVLAQKSVTGDFSVLTPAYPPSTPFSPRKTRTLAIAVILGFVLGVACAFLLEQLDTRVRDEDQVSDTLALSVLGHLPPLARKTGQTGVVQMLVNPFGLMAEAVRVLRGNLDFMGVDGEVHTLLVSSSVQGEGKSMTACNLAVSMALAGKRVVLVDADLRRPRIHTYLGVQNSVGLSSVVARRAELSEALVPITLDKTVGSGDGLAAPDVRVREGALRVFSAGGRDGDDERAADAARARDAGPAGWSTGADDNPVLRVLPSGPLPPNPGEMVASRRFRELVDELADDADLVLIDTPALLSVGDTAAMAAHVDGLVFVVNTTQVRRPMLERSHAQLTKLPCRKLGLVLISSKRAHGPYYGYHYHRASVPKAGRTSTPV